MLKEMIAEEWRIHSSLVGSRMFALFPVLLAALTAGFSIGLPHIGIMPRETIANIMGYFFIMLGLSVGAIGLFGREALNRRFGAASLLAYSAKTLPVSERQIIINLVIKDLIYYFMLWLVPISTGLLPLGFLLPMLALCFMLGLSFSFAASTLYVRIGKAVIYALGFVLAAYYILSGNIKDFELLLVPINSIILTIMFLAISVLFLRLEYTTEKRHCKNSMTKHYFLSKDLIDLSRSQGGLAKIAFSLLIPLIMTSLILLIYKQHFPFISFTIMFSLFLGIISSSVYNWLTEYDTFSQYIFLPITPSILMKSKLQSFAVINLVSLALLIGSVVENSEFHLLLHAIILWLAVTAYSVSVVMLVGGLEPNIRLYSAKVFLQYLLLSLPAVLVLMFISVIDVNLLFLSLVLVPVSYFIYRHALRRWDSDPAGS